MPQTWWAKALQLLKTKAPEKLEAMSETELERHLQDLDQRASQTYKAIVRQAEKDGQPGWYARKMAEELVMRDVLDPTT